MNRRRYLFLLFPILFSLWSSSCGPGQLFGPTITPSPPPSPTPIPGIQAPITVNGIEAQVQSAIVGAELPAGYRLTSAAETSLNVEMTFSGSEDFGDLWKELVVVDENKNESHTGLYSVKMNSDGTMSNTPTFIFGVKKDAKVFSLRFPDGQVIELTPILEFE